MKDNKKMLFKMDVGVDVVACDFCEIGASSILKLDVLESHDTIKIFQILELLGYDFKEAMNHIFLSVNYLVSYDTKSYILYCNVQAFYSEEIL